MFFRRDILNLPSFTNFYIYINNYSKSADQKLLVLVRKLALNDFRNNVMPSAVIELTTLRSQNRHFN